MKRVLYFLIFYILLSLSPNIHACSCIGQRTVKEEIKHSDAVLVGVILNSKLMTLYDSSDFKTFGNSGLPIDEKQIAIYEMLIHSSYKGKISNDTVTILTGMGHGDCGIKFQKNKKYIIYGNYETYFGQKNNNFSFQKAINAFWTNTCSRTDLYSDIEINEIEQYASKQKFEDKELIIPTSDPDVFPVFKDGGETGLMNFIKTNISNPPGEILNGKVFIIFTIDTLGNVKDLIIKKGLTPKADLEAIRVIKLLTFHPGTKNGIPVETRMVLPVKFSTH